MLKLLHVAGDLSSKNGNSCKLPAVTPCSYKGCKRAAVQYLWFVNLCNKTSFSLKIPTPIEGEGGGKQNQPVEFHFFLLGNPGIVIQLLKWNFKVTFLNKPWALVRKYLRLAPEELSASMMMATQFLEGCHPYTCAASVWHVLSSSGAKRKYLIFICLPMIWNDKGCWSLSKKCKKWIFKWNFSTTPPLKFHLRG